MKKKNMTPWPHLCEEFGVHLSVSKMPASRYTMMSSWDIISLFIFNHNIRN